MALRLATLASLIAALACAEPEVPPPAGETLRVAVGGETLELELALDAESRWKGLSGRRSIPRDGGMLFANPAPRELAMVMRDCPVPIDVAFLDAEGRVVALHEMTPEPPRRPDETPFQYERRLRVYPSGAPAQFAIETAGGRLAELGLRVGQKLPFFDAGSLARRARAAAGAGPVGAAGSRSER